MRTFETHPCFLGSIWKIQSRRAPLIKYAFSFIQFVVNISYIVERDQIAAYDITSNQQN